MTCKLKIQLSCFSRKTPVQTEESFWKGKGEDKELGSCARLQSAQANKT